MIINLCGDGLLFFSDGLNEMIVIDPKYIGLVFGNHIEIVIYGHWD